MKIGILAVQGDFDAHRAMLERLGAQTVLVKSPGDLEGLDGLVLPGGESTTHLKFLLEEGLLEPIRALGLRGEAILATCAGAILLAREVKNPAQSSLGLLDVVIERNAYGRQLASEVSAGPSALRPEPLEMVYIRAPVIEQVGPGVEVLARREGSPVLVRQGSILAATFHPELTSDTTVHELFLKLAAAGRGAACCALPLGSGAFQPARRSFSEGAPVHAPLDPTSPPPAPQVSNPGKMVDNTPCSHSEAPTRSVGAEESACGRQRAEEKANSSPALRSLGAGGHAARPNRVLFVCVGNSCRSQIAEALARALASDVIDPSSAGLSPLGEIAEPTRRILLERGVPCDGQYSKGLTETASRHAEVIVNMTGIPGRSLFGEERLVLDWEIRDPFGEDLGVYREVAEEIEENLRKLAEALRAVPDPPVEGAVQDPPVEGAALHRLVQGAESRPGPAEKKKKRASRRHSSGRE